MRRKRHIVFLLTWALATFVIMGGAFIGTPSIALADGSGVDPPMDDPNLNMVSTPDSLLTEPEQSDTDDMTVLDIIIDVIESLI